MTRVLKQQPALSGFDVCHAGGCAHISHVRLSPAEWRQVEAVCEPRPENAGTERVCIANAVGRLEQIVGAKTGTDTDRGGTLGNSDYPGQMDCNDEAINTSTYVKLLIQHGLVIHHELLDVRRRGFFFNGWPHTTAVIRETATQQQYALDAWFYDNGHPAVVLPLEQWQSGWKPEDSPAR
ncbi:hypothetical protein MTYP_00136 [Methylophilaceae bacterium]|nr:hypothetical protein MTYP_00136 [Methylophilaceae bacterium]